MTAFDLALIALALLAVCAAAASSVALIRCRAALGRQRAAQMKALEAAGAESLEDAVTALVAARGRIEAVRRLQPAIEEFVARYERLHTALEERDGAGVTAREARGAVVDEVEHIAEGLAALTHDVGVAGAAFEETVATIATVASTINGLANNVASVSSAIGELAVSVNQVAGSAREASTLSVEANRKASDGGVAVERLVRSTREIADDIHAVVEKMTELGSASERIGAIVEVIDTIADQTNLLALNAAIEAARAGEHGRGFAVVADEVRKLAESSAYSTREIAQLVKDIQAKTAEVVRSTTASGSKAENGLAMADVAGRAIGDISTAVEQANALIEQISLAAREQATGSSSIVNAVEMMNGLTQEAARSLDEQNLANQQIVQIVGAIQTHATGVEASVARQRAALGAVAEATKALTAASDATRDARNGLDDLGETLRERARSFGSAPLARV